MMNAEIWRHEVKCIVQSSDALDLERWLSLHPLGMMRAYPERFVNNLYFDNATHDLFGEHVLGATERKKLRLRWYQDLLGSDLKAALELKIKRYELGRKETWPVSVTVQEGTAWRDLQQALKLQIPAAATAYLKTYDRPVLVNRYLRSYWVQPATGLRVTVDSALQIWDQHHGSSVQTRSQSLPLHHQVLEVKFPPSLHGTASQLMATCPWPVVRHSKYMLGTQMIAAL